MAAKLFYLSSFLLILSTLSCNESLKTKIETDDIYGVWANDSCELIRTNNYRVLIYKKDAVFSGIIEKLETTENTLKVETKVSFQFDPAKKQMQAIGVSLEANNQLLINNTEQLSLSFSEYFLEGGVENSNRRKVYIKPDGKPFEKQTDENTLITYTADGDELTLRRVHHITPVDSYKMSEARRSNIGICIQEWLSGVQIESNEDYNSLQINVNNYNCLIGYGKYNGKDIVYVRTANFATNNKGMVFRQNFRMMSNPIEFTAWISPNHFDDLRTLPSISLENFNNPKLLRTNSDNFWKVELFDNQKIRLQNISGRKFIINRPDTESSNLIEWFNFTPVIKETTLLSAQ